VATFQDDKVSVACEAIIYAGGFIVVTIAGRVRERERERERERFIETIVTREREKRRSDYG
jgi:small neutral amino acid transporter SnatA (MarC family)